MPPFPVSGELCDRLHLGHVFDILMEDLGRFPLLCLCFHFHVSAVVCICFLSSLSPSVLSVSFCYVFDSSLLLSFLHPVYMLSIHCISFPSCQMKITLNISLFLWFHWVLLFSWTLRAGKVRVLFMSHTEGVIFCRRAWLTVFELFGETASAPFSTLWPIFVCLYFHFLKLWL